MSRVIVMLTAACCLAGCAAPAPTVDAGADRQRSAGYALLYELVSKQSNVNQILLLKSASKETKAILADVAASSKDAKAALEGFAAKDAALSLGIDPLPPAERDTRSAIEAATRNKLLFGDRFETRMLLSMAEGTRYGAFVAQTLADSDEDEQRREWLDAFARRYGELHERIVEQLDK